MLRDLAGIHTELDRRVVQPRAVQVQGQTMLLGKLARADQILQRQHFALHGVFQRQQTGPGEMEVVRLDRCRDLIQIQRTVGLHFHRLRLDRAEHRRATAFVLIGVRLLADDVFVATFAVRHQAQQVAHGAGRHEQRSGEPQALRQFRLQTIDRRIFAVDIVTGGRRCHRVEHGRSRLGNGVAAKIDNAHEPGLRVSRGNPFSKVNYCGHGADLSTLE